MCMIVTCRNCGDQVAWMSAHACRITTPGFDAVAGPGFRVRPHFHEVRNLSHPLAEMIGDSPPAVGRKAARVVEYDRTITKIQANSVKEVTA